MSPNTEPNPSGPFLVSIASLLGLLSIFLYFTGWIYRWAYFAFFEVELTELNLPLESFFIVPIQIFLGNFMAIFYLFFCASIFILLSLFLLDLLSLFLLDQVSRINYLKKRGFTGFKNFIQDFIIVVWILIAIFFIAKSQGEADAWRDAVNKTSTRPIFSLISSSDKISLGRNPEDTLINPKNINSRIIGDVELFNTISGTETNVEKGSQDWRLLIKTEHWIYLFRSFSEQELSKKNKTNLHPFLLAINTDDGRVQYLIISNPKKQSVKKP